MPSNRREVQTALTAVYCWNYSSELEEIRTLYAKGLDAQWSAVRDIDWGVEQKAESLPTTFTVDGIPISRSQFWQELDPAIRAEIHKRMLAHTLSNLLHGEQGALLIAGQLVGALPDMDAKLFAAMQTIDEARHVEVFSAYVKRLHKIHKITPGLGALLDDVAAAPHWLEKLVGMQVVVEGVALSYFRTVQIECTDPLLRQIVRYVSRDEARHVGFGLRYLRRAVDEVSEARRMELEDFAFESVRRLKDPTIELSVRRRLSQLWKVIGLDPTETWRRIWADVAGLGPSESESDPISDIVVPTLRKVNLMSPRIEAAFDALYQINLPGRESLLAHRRELPLDLHAWASGEIE